MSITENQEKKVSEAFSRQSAIFDELDEKNPIIQVMRQRVREHILSFLRPGDSILELNAGTGIDAVFFAQQGFMVHATDNASGMLKTLEQKISSLHLEEKITAEQCSFNHLEKLKNKKFDYIFSNFGGLNCAEHIEKVINQFEQLLHPNGKVTLVMMPPFCPWELALALKGNFKVAFRRFAKQGVRSHLEGVYFTTYYFSPKQLIKSFGKKYEKIALMGLGIVYPPPYMESFPVKYPRIFRFLTAVEKKFSHKFPFSSWGDHYILTMEKNG